MRNDSVVSDNYPPIYQFNNTATGYALTPHAWQRITKRPIPLDGIAAVFQYGRSFTLAAR